MRFRANTHGGPSRDEVGISLMAVGPSGLPGDIPIEKVKIGVLLAIGNKSMSYDPIQVHPVP
jgi:hypothetical protein